MEYYVYEIINLLGTIEHVGETTNINTRYKNHKSINGKFYNRQDIFLNIVDKFDNKKKAYDYQCELQNQYGLITDKQHCSNAGKIGGKLSNGYNHKHNIKIAPLGFQAQCVELKCPKCGKIGKGRTMYRWHFDKCTK